MALIGKRVAKTRNSMQIYEDKGRTYVGGKRRVYGISYPPTPTPIHVRQDTFFGQRARYRTDGEKGRAHMVAWKGPYEGK